MMLYYVYFTPQKSGICNQINCQEKCFIIYIYKTPKVAIVIFHSMSTKTRGALIKGYKFSLAQNEKQLKLLWGFLYL